MSDPSGWIEKRGFGWKPDSPDRRDRALFRGVINIDALPERANVGNLMPAAMDQHSTGSCTGYSFGNVAHGVMIKDKHRRPFVPSPVFMYREARVLGGYVEEDGGAEIRNVWKAANRLGMAVMSDLVPRFDKASLADPRTWIFPEKSIWRREPTKSVYNGALNRQALTYYKLFDLGDLLKCIADGWPAQIGFTVFKSFYSPSGFPYFNIPDPTEFELRQPLGGHAVCAYAYDKANRRVFFRNSWGPTPHEGKPDFSLSFDYVTKYASDMWTGRLFEGGVPVGV